MKGARCNVHWHPHTELQTASAPGMTSSKKRYRRSNLSANGLLPPKDLIEQSILSLRGYRVMLDADLASLYGVETRILVQAVKRNIERFPDDFMMQLTHEEFDHLKSQNVRLSSWGGRRYPPYAFTEQGVAMLSSVLRSKRAVQVNIEIMRAFVRIRSLLADHEDLKRRLTALEGRYDRKFRIVFEAIRQLMAPEDEARRKIGFASGKNK